MKIFISSTILDLRDLRSSLQSALESEGHVVLASESGTIPVDFRKHSYDVCLAAAAECDCLIAIIDGRFGGSMPDRTSSITQAEIDVAIKSNNVKHILVFVRQSVWDAKEIYKTYMKSGADFKSTRLVEDERVFQLLDWIRSRKTGNWIFQFNTPNDVLRIVKSQIAGITLDAVEIPSRIPSEAEEFTQGELPSAAGQLADLMSDISEAGMSASWLDGLEYTLWHALKNGPLSFWKLKINERHIRALDALSKQCNGWVYYGHHELQWVPLDVWERHYQDPKNYPLPASGNWTYNGKGRDREIVALTSVSELGDSLKREALFFDKIAVQGLFYEMDDYALFSGEERPPIRDPHIEDLFVMIDNGLALPSVPTSTFYIKGSAEAELAAILDKLEWDSPEHDAAYARLTAMQMRRKQGVEAIPLFRGASSLQQVAALKRQAIVRLVLNKLPIPDKSVSWEQIIAYKTDPDSRRRFAGLRDWVNEVSRSELKPSEIADKIEWLTEQYDAHLRTHRLDHAPGPFEFVITTTAEIAEYLVRLQWKKATQTFFSVLDGNNLNALRAELSAPGSQIAYLSHAKKKFKNGAG